MTAATSRPGSLWRQGSGRRTPGRGWGGLRSARDNEPAPGPLRTRGGNPGEDSSRHVPAVRIENDPRALRIVRRHEGDGPRNAVLTHCVFMSSPLCRTGRRAYSRMVARTSLNGWTAPSPLRARRELEGIRTQSASQRRQVRAGGWRASSSPRASPNTPGVRRSSHRSPRSWRRRSGAGRLPRGVARHPGDPHGSAGAQRWIDNSRARLTTETGQRLAEELLGQGPLDWLRAALGEKG